MDSNTEKRIMENLKVLGAKLYDPWIDPQKVYDALVAAWKGRKGKPPTAAELSKATGIGIPGVRRRMAMLIAEGRVLYSGRYRWVPIVTKKNSLDKKHR